MISLKLTRTQSLVNGTTGYVDLPTARRLYTIEPPWLNDQADQSCVPAGIYTLMPYNSPTHGPTWYLENAELGVGGAGAQRSYCELHSANWARQLLGCIAFGEGGQPMFDPLTNIVEPAVEQSRDAIEILLAALGPLSTGNTLEIVYADGAAP